VLVIKRGPEPTIVCSKTAENPDAPVNGTECSSSQVLLQEVPTFAVEICNVLGAGDAFAAGFLYAYLKGWDLYRATRMGNACGAIVVTRHGCANFMPFEDEALRFINDRGGF